jgi:2-desacetyl-2-hydroxyethyl bacteriochlorophyllide A dehydrogenase
MTTLINRVLATADGITIQRAEQPVPGRGEALVAMRAAGVCGSDLHAVAGKHPFVPLPYRPGHEVVGIVIAIGEQVSSVTVGQRVVVEPTLPCWTCKMCRSGRENLCENLVFFGCGYGQGGMAGAFTVPVNRLHAVPEEFDDRTAALIEPLSTPVHAARLAGPLSGKSVVILGAGTIGLLLLAVVRAQRPARIVVTDLRPANRDRADRLGADCVVDGADPDLIATVRDALGESADVVFDCVALQPTVDSAITLADKGGTVVIVGVPEAGVRVPLPLIQDHQIRIQGSATYLPADFADAIAMLRAGRVDVDAIVTAQFPMAQAAAAFAAAASGEHVKVLITAD